MSQKVGDYKRTMGKDAQRDNIATAKLLGEIVKTTLGPKGMDKVLMDAQGHLTITNDGYTILNEMDIQHPAGKMISEISRTQENEIGDGTTSAVMLAGRLLENAEKLLSKGIHPTMICKGYSMAAEKAKEIVKSTSYHLDGNSLKQVAMTAMTGKAAEGSRELLAELIVDAIDTVKEGEEVNIGRIKIQKVTGSSVDKSDIVKGVVLDKLIAHEGMPRKMGNAQIALLDVGLEIKNPELEVMSQVSTPDELESFRQHDTNQIKMMVDQLIKVGVGVVLTQKGFDDLALHELAKNGIIGVRRINKYDMDQIARATGGRIVSSIDELKREDLGKAGEIREARGKETNLLYIEECKNPKAVTLLIHSSTGHLVDEITRAVTDGIGDVISAFNNKLVIAGGGATEMIMAQKLREFARTLTGREQLAVEQFADALEYIPETLAENAGLDPINTLTEIKQRLEAGEVVGLNLFTETIEDTFSAGIIEPLQIKTQAIDSATEVSIMILRIDDMLAAKNAPTTS